MKIRNFSIMMISALLMITLFVGCGSQYDDNVITVREGRFNGYPNVPVGAAFDQFFSDGQWDSFTSTNNETVVEFKGSCKWNDIPAKLRMQFTVSGEHFEVNYFAIDGNPVTIEEGIDSIEKILSEYRPKK